MDEVVGYALRRDGRQERITQIRGEGAPGPLLAVALARDPSIDSLLWLSDLTVPGAPSIRSLCIVWIESITSSAGGAPIDSVVRISRTDVAAASCTGALPSPSRRARRRT